MPGISGLSVLEGIHGCSKVPPMILITAFGDEDTHRRALRSAAVAVLDKPFSTEDLLATVREAVSGSHNRS
jgi:DNA-binding response OmpR family regulator